MKFLREYTISTHAPAGGATRSPFAFGPSSKFLLTPLREGRHSPRTSKNSTATYFYSRPCGRGDGGGARAAHGDVVISTHAPAGGATVALSANALREVFLLTPLREGRHRLVGHDAGRKPHISTHAPAGGATKTSNTKSVSITISTHAPAGGATTIGPQRAILNCYFYSRPCGRGDRQTFPYHQYLGFISTHAPAGGATVFPVADLQTARNISTHAPAGGATTLNADGSVTYVIFLLTPLREGRLRA